MEWACWNMALPLAAHLDQMFAFLFLVCKRESHPSVSWSVGGWPLGAALLDFKDLPYVSFSSLSLIQWFDTAPSRTCPQCRIQVKPSPLFLWHDALLNGTEEPWSGPVVMQGKGSWYEVERAFCPQRLRG